MTESAEKKNGVDTAPEDPYPDKPEACPHDQLELIAVDRLKEIGNELYKRKNFGGALEKYSKAIRYVEGLFWISKLDDPELKKIPLLSNRAACNLQLRNWNAVVEDCKEILIVEQENPKALYRMGEALGELGQFGEAKESLRKAVKAAPKDPAIRTSLQNVEKKETETKEKEKQLYFGTLTKNNET